MIALGVRCSNTDLAYSLLTGGQQAPVVLQSGDLAFPKNFARPQRLTWIVQEVEGLVRQHHAELVVIRSFEGLKKGTAYEERVEAEAAVAVAAGNCGIKALYKKRKNTLAKDLGFKGRGKYLQLLDTSVIAGFESLSPKVQEAVICAWSGLR